MHIRQIGIGVVLVVLVFTPGFPLAQGGGTWRPSVIPPVTSGPDRGSRMQMQGMMQQMGGMLDHMAARIQAGPVTPEQAKQMSEVMEHIAEMMSNRSWMTGEDTPRQMSDMLERMTEMHKRLMVIMATPAPGSRQEKR
jgi:hypothetical protein